MTVRGRDMNRFVMLALMLALAACAKPVPIDAQRMLPSEKVYEQTSDRFYLKHKIVLGEFEYAGVNKQVGDVTFANFRAAVEQALRKGGYLADGDHGTYRLSGKIMEVKVPHCVFGTCESGSAIEYTLTHTGSGKIAFQQLVVVPYTMECPVFMNDSMVAQIIMKAYTETVGANIAQLIQILNRKTAADLR
jgi:hypothetical protein